MILLRYLPYVLNKYVIMQDTTNLSPYTLSVDACVVVPEFLAAWVGLDSPGKITFSTKSQSIFVFPRTGFIFVYYITKSS